jgi:hypothetical protein
MSKKKNRLNIQSVHPPKQVKKTPSRAAKKAAQSVATPPLQKNTSKRRNVVTIASIALVVVIVAVIIFYIAAILPMQRTILTVGNDNIKTGYFIRRVVANPYGNVSSTIQLLTAELIIKQEAATYGVAPVTEQAIDTYLREEANSSLSNDTTTDSTATPTTTPTLSDAEYDKWFDEQLANTGLSTKEYREIAGREIQRQRLTNILSADIPSTMPQVHLWAIVYSSNSAALAGKAKIDGGTDFSAVAVTAGQTNNGDQGWMPLVVLPTDLKNAASTLEVGKCSDPISYVQSSSSSSSGTTTSYILLMISEKSDAMPLTADQLTILKNNGLTNWLNTQASNVKITFHGLHGSTTLDTQTSTWLDYQVQKLAKKRPSTETTSPATIVPATPNQTTTTTSITSP